MRFVVNEKENTILYVSFRNTPCPVPLKYVVEGKGPNGIFNSKAFTDMQEADYYFDTLI